MAAGITLRIGPAPSDIVMEWIASRSRFVEVARRDARFAARDDVLDLLETILALWQDHASRSDVFDWSHRFDADVLLLVGRYWLELGQLTADDRAAMGAPLASPRAEAFTDVVVRGMVDALRQAGPDGAALLARLGV